MRHGRVQTGRGPAARTKSTEIPGGVTQSIAAMQVVGTAQLPNGMAARHTSRTAPAVPQHQQHNGRARVSSEDSLYGSHRDAAQPPHHQQHHDGHSYHDDRDTMPISHALAACVKVFCTAVAPCYALPWVRGEESHTTGSGFAALLPNGERRLLVHAQVLEAKAEVEVEFQQSRDVIDKAYTSVLSEAGSPPAGRWPTRCRRAPSRSSATPPCKSRAPPRSTGSPSTTGDPRRAS